MSSTSFFICCIPVRSHLTGSAGQNSENGASAESLGSCSISLCIQNCIMADSDCYLCCLQWPLLDCLTSWLHLVQFWPNVQCLREHYNNFNSYLAILSAIESSPVSRLDWPDRVIKVCGDKDKGIHPESLPWSIPAIHTVIESWRSLPVYYPGSGGSQSINRQQRVLQELPWSI